MRATHTISLIITSLLFVVPASGFAQEDEIIEEDEGDVESSATEDSPAGAEAVAPEASESESAGAQFDVDALRREYLKLRDRLFRSKARAAAVASTVYSSQIELYLDYKSARHYSITRASVRLDGSNVYEDSEGAVSSDGAPRYTGYVAPGRHQLTVRLEAVAKDDERFRTSLESTFTIQVPAERSVFVGISAKDDGDIAYNWKKKQSGSYKLHLDTKVKAKKITTGKKTQLRKKN